MRKSFSLAIGFTFAIVVASSVAFAQNSGGSRAQGSNVTGDRSVLPLPNTVRQEVITYDAKSPDTRLPPIPQLRPPKGAPNVLIVLIDDVGFGASSTSRHSLVASPYVNSGTPQM